MAGTYPDAPGPQIMYDKDGSAGFAVPSGGGTPAAMSASALTLLNNWLNDVAYQVGTGNGNYYGGVIFPQGMDIVGFFCSVSSDNTITGGYTITPQYSTNTTNGNDGVWTNLTITDGNSNLWNAAFLPYARQNVQTLSGLTGVLGVRCGGGHFQSQPRFQTLHLYGTPSSTNAPDRLRIWHPTLNQEMSGAGLDFGDFGRGGTASRTFRIKNNSSSLTANSIVLSTEALLADASPAVAGQTTLSQGAGFASTQNIGNLGVGAISGVCTLQIASTTGEQLGQWRQRLIATAGSWT